MNNRSEKNALDVLFKVDEQKTIYGEIVERITSRKFKILDDLDRYLIVNADRDWSLGVSVIVQNNLIIGTGKRSGSFRTYKV